MHHTSTGTPFALEMGYVLGFYSTHKYPNPISTMKRKYVRSYTSHNDPNPIPIIKEDRVRVLILILLCSWCKHHNYIVINMVVWDLANLTW